jgi:hypothetical protein
MRSSLGSEEIGQKSKSPECAGRLNMDGFGTSRAIRRGGEILTINNGMKPRVDTLENRFIFRMNAKEGG